MGFLAVYLALIVPNYVAFLHALANSAFGIPAMSRQYALTWFTLIVCTAILLPPLIKLRLKTPTIAFLVASMFAMILNGILPAGMM